MAPQHPALRGLPASSSLCACVAQGFSAPVDTERRIRSLPFCRETSGNESRDEVGGKGWKKAGLFGDPNT